MEIIHLAESWNIREAKSAIKLCLPGIWATDKWERCFLQISQISIVNLLHIDEWVTLFIDVGHSKAIASHNPNMFDVRI